MKKILYAIFGLIVIALLGWATYSFTTNIPGSIITPLFLAGIAIYVQKEIKRREVESRHFEYKIERYEKFLDLIFNIGESGSKRMSEKNLVGEMLKLKKVIMLWGSVETIRAFEKFGEASQAEMDDIDKVLLGDALISSIRKDLGHNDWQLKKGELTLFLIKSSDKQKDELRKRIK